MSNKIRYNPAICCYNLVIINNINKLRNIFQCFLKHVIVQEL